ncbi:MAG: LptA/OstA family protein, partial [Candidatus Margulisbacteria bacterium]|nr:LptA/OstA family protein [Candidatus Margulisiibacteriota bacterium]
MDENLAWKIVYAAAIFSLLILGIAYYLISPRDTAPVDQADLTKAAEFQNTRLEGRKEGKKIWEFTAKNGWTEKNQAMTFLFDVSRGRIFSGGKLAVDDLSAPRVKVHRSAEVVEAFGPLKAELDLGKFSSAEKKGRWTKMIADYIKYVPAEKKSEIDGRVTLTMKDGVIKAGHISVDHEKKIARIFEAVKVKRANGTIMTGALNYLAESEQADVPGPLTLALKEKAVRTDLKCNRGTFFMDINKDIALFGSVEVIQGKKVAIADEGIYSRRLGSLLLKGRTRTVLEKGGVLLKQGSAAKLRDPDVKEILRNKTVVTANEISFSTKTGDARAAGEVVVTQKGRDAKSDLAVYDDKKEILTLSGNVFMKQKDEWLNCRQVIISVSKETFEAKG